MANPFDQFDAQPVQPRGIVIGTPNAARKFDVPLKEIEVARGRQGLQEGQTKLATAPFDVRKAAADARIAELNANAKADEAKSAVDPKVQGAIDNLQLDDMLHAIGRARKLIGQGGTTGVVGSIGRIFPGSGANDLAGSINTIGGNVLLDRLKELKQASATGASGLGALSNKEGDYLRDAVASLSLRQSPEALNDALSRIELHIGNLRAIRDGKNPSDPQVQKAYGIGAALPGAAVGGAGGGSAPGGSGGSGGPSGGAGGPAMGLSPGGTQTVTDPALKGVNSEVARRIGAGQSAGDVRAYLNAVQPGLGAKAVNLDAWVKFHNAHPDQPVSVALDKIEKPLTPAGSLLNTAAQSPLGAYAMGAGDFLSGGTLDNMTSNPALTRAGMQGVAQENPGSTLAGQVSGGALSGILGEAGLARAGAGGLASMLGGDVLPGAAYGAGSADDGSRVGGAVTGGLAGLVGNLGGRALGATVRGATNPSVGYLARQGVRMTPGQLFGGMGKTIEDRLSGFPITGDIINSMRRRGAQDANLAAFQNAAPAVTDIGQAGYQQLREEVGKAYKNALSGVVVQPDPSFATDFAGNFQKGASLPGGMGDQFAHVVQNKLMPILQGGPTISGDQFQDALRLIRKSKSDYQKAASSGSNPLGSDVADALGGIEDSLVNLVRRQSPETMPALDAANQMYAKKEAIKAALPPTDDQLMSAVNLARASRAGRTKFGGGDAAAAGDRPFNDLTNAWQATLPSKIPDSGTAGRWMLPALATAAGGAIGGGGEYANQGTGNSALEGAGTGGLSGLALAGALASPYAARGLIQRALTNPRLPLEQKLGQFLIDSRIPGALGVPLLAGGN